MDERLDFKKKNNKFFFIEMKRTLCTNDSPKITIIQWTLQQNMHQCDQTYRTTQTTTLPTYHALTIYIFFSFSSQIHYNIVVSHELKLEEDIYIKKTISCLQICSLIKSTRPIWIFSTIYITEFERSKAVTHKLEL